MSFFSVHLPESNKISIKTGLNHTIYYDLQGFIYLSIFISQNIDL